MARVEHTCTGCVPIDASIIDVYVTLVETNKAVTNAEAGRVTAEGERVAAETERTATFTADHGRAVSDHSIAQQDHALAGTDHSASAAATASANAAAALANLKAGLVQQRLDTADADHTRAEGDHNTAVSDHSTALADHSTAQSDHSAAGTDHTRAGQDHSRAETDHGVASSDHETAASDHETAVDDQALADSDHETASADHTLAASDHTTAASDHGTATADHTQASADHTQAGTDHSTAASDHTAAASDHTRAGQDHTLAAADHTTAGEDHTQALADHAVMSGYDTRLGAVEDDVTELEAKVTDLDEAMVGIVDATVEGENEITLSDLDPAPQTIPIRLSTRNLLLLPFDMVVSGNVPTYDYTPITLNGITFTPNRDGSITITGTANALTPIGLRSYYSNASNATRITFPAGIYKASLVATGAGAGIRYYPGFDGFSYAYDGHPLDINNGASKLTNAILSVANGYSAPVGGIKVYPQLELGDKQTAFQTPLTKLNNPSVDATFPDTTISVEQLSTEDFTIQGGVGVVTLENSTRAKIKSNYFFTIQTTYKQKIGDTLRMAKQAFSSAVGFPGITEERATFATGDSISLISTMAKKNKVLSFFANVTTMGTLRFIHGDDIYASGDVTIDGTNVVVRMKYNSYSDMLNVAHGLTIKDYIAVTLEVGDTNNMKLTIRTNGGVYTRPNVIFGASRGQVAVFAVSGSYTNARASWWCDAFSFPIWLFGDSYLDVANNARWPKQVIDAGFTKFYAAGYGGAQDMGVIMEFREAIKRGNPKYILWALGMNDADNGEINTDWLSCVQEVIQTCEELGIVPVLATIPNCPSINHTYKNAWVRASGYRYVDFASAVGATANNSTWFDGMLSSDNVHPTTDGAIALAYRAMADMPELTR